MRFRVVISNDFVVEGCDRERFGRGVAALMRALAAADTASDVAPDQRNKPIMWEFDHSDPATLTICGFAPPQ